MTGSPPRYRVPSGRMRGSREPGDGIPETGSGGGHSQTALHQDRSEPFFRTSALRRGALDLLSLSDEYEPIGEPRKLIEIGEQTRGLCWAQQGKEIIYSAGPWTGARLFRVAVSGHDGIREIPVPGLNVQRPAVSISGHRLVYSDHPIDLDIWWRELAAGPSPRAENGSTTST